MTQLNSSLTFFALAKSAEKTRRWVSVFGENPQSICSHEELRQAILEGVDTQCEWRWKKNYDSFWHLFTRSFLDISVSQNGIDLKSYFELLDLSIKKGVDLNAKRYHTCNLLSCALAMHRDEMNSIQQNNYEQLLIGILERGIDINALDSQQEHNLFLGIMTLRPSVVQLLLDHGANTKDFNFNDRKIKAFTNSETEGVILECLERIRSAQQRHELLSGASSPKSHTASYRL